MPHAYRLAWPHPSLAGLVVQYLGYDEHSAAVVRRHQVPSGACTLLLSFDSPIRLCGPAGPVVRRSFFAGMHDVPLVTEYVGAQAGVEVVLTPVGAHVLLGRPMRELTNRTPSLVELGHPALANLPAQLASTTAWPRRFRHVDSTLQRLVQVSGARPDPEVGYAWRELVRTEGRTRIQPIADTVGWTRRRLSVRFTGQIGLAPKAAGRVLRLAHAARLLTAPRVAVPNIADVASAAGYADHSHLDREFRDLAGCSPGQYRATWQGDPFVQDQLGDGALPSRA